MVGLANPVPLVTAIVSLVPAGILFFVAYGRYDGLFRDNVVFLFFMGGLVVGAFLSLFGVYMVLFAPLLFVTVVPILYGIVPTSLINRRKWQGERHSVFNGGAMGLGVASMTAFAFTFRSLGLELSWAATAIWFAIALGLAGNQYAAGLIIGAGVLDRKPIRAALLAAVVTAGYFVLLSEYLGSRHPFWVVLALAVGLGAYALAFARLMPRGVESGARRRAMRRHADA